MSYGERCVGCDRFDGLEEGRPFGKRREIRDNLEDHLGRSGDSDRGMYNTVGGVGVVCHGGCGESIRQVVHSDS